MDDLNLRERVRCWTLVLFAGAAGLSLAGCSSNESVSPDRASDSVLASVAYVKPDSVEEDVWQANSRHEWDPRERLPWDGKPGPLLPGCSLKFLRRRVEIDLGDHRSPWSVLVRTLDPPNQASFSSQEELYSHLAKTMDSFDTLCVYGALWGSDLSTTISDQLKELCSTHQKQLVLIGCNGPVTYSVEGENFHAWLEARRRIPLLDD